MLNIGGLKIMLNSGSPKLLEASENHCDYYSFAQVLISVPEFYEDGRLDERSGNLTSDISTRTAEWSMHYRPSLGAGLVHSILLKSGRRFDFSGYL